MSTQQQTDILNDVLGGDYLHLLKRNIPPPADRFISKGDRLYIAIWNAVTDLAVKVSGVVLLKNGSKAVFNFRVLPTDDRAISEYFREIPKGFLLSAIAYPEGSTNRGQSFIHVSLVRGGDNADNRFNLLIQNYLQSGNALSFPNGQIQDSVQGSGYIRVVTGTNPAANTEVSETVPTNARWRILVARIQLLCDANVANRFPILRLDDGVTWYWRSKDFDAIVASDNAIMNWARDEEFQTAPDTSVASGIDSYHNSLPENILLAGYRIQTVTIGLQATDDYAAPFLLIEEWIEE